MWRQNFIVLSQTHECMLFLNCVLSSCADVQHRTSLSIPKYGVLFIIFVSNIQACILGVCDDSYSSPQWSRQGWHCFSASSWRRDNVLFARNNQWLTENCHCWWEARASDNSGMRFNSFIQYLHTIWIQPVWLHTIYLSIQFDAVKCFLILILRQFFCFWILVNVSVIL